MKKILIVISFFSLFIISLVSCSDTQYTVANQQNKSKQEEEQKKIEKVQAKYIELLESGKSYEEMNSTDRTNVITLLGSWNDQDEDFKNKYSSQKEFLEKSVQEWNSGADERKKLEENTPQNVTSNYKALHGKLLDANKLGKTLTVKFKIEPSLSKKLTISENGLNVQDLIVNQGADQFDTISYWAVADMQDGTESKVITFTLNKELIGLIENKQIASGSSIINKAEKVWILPSLKE